MSTLAHEFAGPRRSLVTGLAAAGIVLCLFALPDVRAAAGQFLQIFRVQTVVFMPVAADRVRQLAQLNVDQDALFLARPDIVNHPAPPLTGLSAEQASERLGFTLQEPSVFPSPPLSTERLVHNRCLFRFQVNVAAAQHIFDLMSVDEQLPEALGSQPITADLPPAAETRYAGQDYTLTLFEGISPTVELPDGVEFAPLGRAALRLLGMDAEKADALSREIDWSSTLLFPFPAGLDTVRQVSVNGVSGLLVGEGDRTRSDWVLYWQRGSRFYVLRGQGHGIGDGDLITAAESIH
jgi:hypothetical protein